MHAGIDKINEHSLTNDEILNCSERNLYSYASGMCVHLCEILDRNLIAPLEAEICSLLSRLAHDHLDVRCMPVAHRTAVPAPMNARRDVFNQMLIVGQVASEFRESQSLRGMRTSSESLGVSYC